MAGGQGYVGEVQSGDGGSYVMELNNGRQVIVTILQIDEDEVIPVGTKLLVVNQGGRYFAQPPVWL